MATGIARQARIDARVPADVYDTLCRAAELSGVTVNQFLIQSALKEAQAVIELKTPNAETHAAMREARAMGKARFGSVEALIGDIEKGSKRSPRDRS